MHYIQIAAIAIGGIVLAISYSTLYKRLGVIKNASTVISFSFAIITYIYLIGNPNILSSTIIKIGAIMVGIVITLAFLISRYM